MKILGIDPGYAILGYGVIEKTGNKFKPCRYGAVTTDASMKMTDRLAHLYDSLREIIDEERPESSCFSITTPRLPSWWDRQEAWLCWHASKAA